MAFDAKHKKAVASDAKLATTMAGSANFEDRENQIRAQLSGFDLERRSRGVSARWLLMQSIKKPSQAMRSLRRRWQGQPILRTGALHSNIVYPAG